MNDLARFRAFIDDVTLQVQAGEALPAKPGESNEAAALLVVLRRSARRGAPLLPCLAALRHELHEADAYLAERRRLEKLATFRLVLAACFAVAARAWIAGGRFLPASPTDALTLVAAMVLAVLFQAGARTYLPGNWFWRGVLTVDAWLWLRALLGERVSPADLVTGMEKLRADELRRGVSRQDVRSGLLADFATRRRDASRQSLAKAEAAWPMAELLGIGLPVLLVVLMPARAMIGV